MSVVAFLQNQWFKRPEVAGRVLAGCQKTLGDGPGLDQFVARTLFLSRTGKILRQGLGDELCDRIIWADASRELCGSPRDNPGFDRDHVRSVLDRHRPDIVIAFGRVAATIEILRKEFGFDLVQCPHPTSRRADIRDKLWRLRAELNQRIASVEQVAKQ